MNPRFARRMSLLRASEIRELLKLTQNPRMISFAGGLPAPEYFPVDEMIEVTRRVLSTRGSEALQYSTTEGYLPLRRKIAQRMTRTVSVEARPEEILITSGSQQALDLTGKLFLDEGDVILCESPTYLGAISAFRAYFPRFQEVPTDDDGMLLPELDLLLKTTERVRLIYVVPDFQNPTGRTWSLERRQGLVELARHHQVPIVEDAPYSEIRFKGTPLPSVKSLDKDGLVIYLSTFSKIFSPGMRIGWITAAPTILEKYVLLKQGADLHTCILSQMEIDAYLEMFDMDERLERCRMAYRRRRDVMVHTLGEEMPGGVHFTRPEGGLFLWLELPEGLDTRVLLERSLQRDVAFVPGGAFFPNGGHQNTLRLCFSTMPEDRIAEGVCRLGSVMREFMEVPEDTVHVDALQMAS